MKSRSAILLVLMVNEIVVECIDITRLRSITTYICTVSGYYIQKHRFTHVSSSLRAVLFCLVVTQRSHSLFMQCIADMKPSKATQICPLLHVPAINID